METKYKLSVVLTKGGNKKELKGVLDGFACQEGISPQEIQIVYFDQKGDGIDAVLERYRDEHGMAVALVSDAVKLLDAIEGDKVVFSNGFDIWEKSAIGQLIRFLDENQNVDVVLGKHVSLFEKEKNKKPSSAYNGGTVRDSSKDEIRPVIDIRITMIRRSALQKAVPYAGVETMDVMSVMVMALDVKELYGSVPTAILLVKDDWFNLDMSGIADFAKEVRANSIKHHGKVSNYVNKVISRMVMRSIKDGIHEADVKECLKELPDKYIHDSFEALPAHIKYAYTMKYGRDIYKESQVNEKGQFIYDGTCVFDTFAIGSIVIKISTVEGGMITLEGYTDLTLADENVKIVFRDNTGKIYEAQIIDFPVADEHGYNGEKIFNGVRFVLSAPAVSNTAYEILVKYSGDENYHKTTVKTGAFSRLNDETNTSYFVDKGLMIKYKDKKFVIEKNSGLKHLKQEIRHLKAINAQGLSNVVKFRLLYWLTKPFNSGKPVWLVVDRPHVANDNGEHFFRYLMKTGKTKVVRPYFLLKKSSPDFERLEKVGPMLEYGSVKHKLKTLHSSKIISAAGNNLALNPFGRNRKYYQDLYQFDFVYLRHGVSHNDQSSWLNRLDKNIRILDTTSKYERDAILAGNYLYDESRVWLTGLPRYDNLYDESKNKITIMPTWRKNLEGPLMPHSSQRAYIRDFKETDYYQFYNGLINDERLLDVMRKHGYTGTFYMHPVFEKQTKDFQSNDVFEVGEGVADYQTVFRESNLMITDFSSVAFDFAYLKKPVIYSQFDAESFYKNHVWGRGYFTYEANGFGPITRDLESTVLTLIDYIEHDCKMKQEYVDRVEDFFAFTDRNNCERVYQAICTVK